MSDDEDFVFVPPLAYYAAVIQRAWKNYIRTFYYLAPPLAYSYYAAVIQRAWKNHIRTFYYLAYVCIDKFSCNSHFCGQMQNNRNKVINYCKLDTRYVTKENYKRIGRLKPWDIAGSPGSGKSSIFTSSKYLHKLFPTNEVNTLSSWAEEPFKLSNGSVIYKPIVMCPEVTTGQVQENLHMNTK